MSSQIPPDPYFSGINYNPSFFSTVVEYLTEAIANSKYLRLIGGILSGNLGIKRTPAVELDVNGKAYVNNSFGALPGNGTYGSNGTRLILFPGTASEPPFALGYNADTLWYGTRSTGSHIFYTGTTERMRINDTGNIITSGNIDCGGGIAINGSPAFYSIVAVHADNIANTYLNLKFAGTASDWCYMRQIGGDNAYKLAFDFHDDDADARFCLRKINSSAFDPDNVKEVFTVDNGNITCTGNINMGSDNNFPEIRLGSANGNNIGIATAAGSFSTSALVNDMVIRSINRLILQSGSGKAAIKIGTNNNIALGIDTPTTYPITIGSSLFGTATTLPTYASAGVGAYIGNQTAGLTPDIVLGITNSTLFTSGFYLYSDERIKKDIQPLENSLDLINKINPISFKYIDYVQKGTINNYGVIAQEIEKIIPEVVNSHKDYIPNIYKNVDKYDNDLLRLYIKTDELSVGDKIKIYDINNKYHYKKIIEITEDYIVIDEPIENYEEGTDVFIFGKEVDEVKNVNYEALFVINIKATQELHQRLRALEEKINLIK